MDFVVPLSVIFPTVDGCAYDLSQCLQSTWHVYFDLWTASWNSAHNSGFLTVRLNAHIGISLSYPLIPYTKDEYHRSFIKIFLEFQQASRILLSYEVGTDWLQFVASGGIFRQGTWHISTWTLIGVDLRYGLIGENRFIITHDDWDKRPDCGNTNSKRKKWKKK